MGEGIVFGARRALPALGLPALLLLGTALSCGRRESGPTPAAGPPGRRAAASGPTGGLPEPSDPHAAPATRWLKPFSRGGSYRWLDAADRPYSPAFRKSFRYAGHQVLVKYLELDDEVLRGEIIAHGLKPNFAYQIKLEGQPAERYPWPSEEPPLARNRANQQIGKLGRWWCVDCEWNTSDWGLTGQYHEGHRVLGYLLFDFFLTNSRGHASYTFEVRNSFHVLWKLSQFPPSESDGKPRKFALKATKAYGYEKDLGTSEVAIYAEQEYGRAPCGTVRLPPGEYRCRLLLTEESFHSYGWGDEEHLGGDWAHCLSDEELTFRITQPPEEATQPVEDVEPPPHAADRPVHEPEPDEEEY